MGVVKLTVRLPAALHEALTQRARRERKSLNAEVVETLQSQIGVDAAVESERDLVRRVLREHNMLAEPGPVWDAYIAQAPDVTIEEVRELWKGQRPLSEDIVADRGDRAAAGPAAEPDGVTLVVRLPRRVHRGLQYCANEEQSTLNQIIMQAAELLLRRSEAERPQESEYDRAMRLLAVGGVIEPMGPEWDKQLSGKPLKTAAEIREALKGMAPLSDDIIADRGER